MNKGYLVLERPLREDILVRQPLQASMVVVHSTANPGAGDESHFKWLDSARQHGWAHYYLDHDSISQLVPEGFQAPAQGPTCNTKAISIEICEPSQKLTMAQQMNEFNAAWSRAVWLTADIMVRHGFLMGQLYSHSEISQMYPKETDHTDPLNFFKRYGKSWNHFLQDVRSQLELMSSLYPPATEWQMGYIDKAMDQKLLDTRRHPNQPMLWWEFFAMLEKVRNQKEM